MDKLIAGVDRFRCREYAENRAFFRQLAAKPQKPLALFITCSDSRVNPNLITQTEPGDLFLLRNAGNLVPPYGAGGGEAATIEYSLEVLGVRDIIICGHSQCGAIQAILEDERLSHLPAVKAWCHHAETTRRIVQQKHRDLTPAAKATAAAQENVLVQINHLSTHPSVAARLAAGALDVHGWYYNIGAGEVWQHEPSLGQFCRLGDDSQEKPTAARLHEIAAPSASDRPTASRTTIAEARR
jgi:carbonic anhydrase